VVLVHVKVARRRQAEVEQPVVCERRQEVVQHPDARRDLGHARAVQVESDGDVGLACPAPDLHGASASGTDID